MAVIPSGTSDPSQWAQREIAENNALFRMFQQQAQQRDLMSMQQDAAEQRQTSQQQWQTGERALDRANARDVATIRSNYGSMDGDPSSALSDEVKQAAPELRAIEQKYNLPPRLLDTYLVLENGGGRNVGKNPNSSANGYFQFIDSTAKQYGLTDRNNLLQAAEAAARLASDNRALFVKSTGKEPEAGDYYFMHQQGGGAPGKVASDPTGKAALLFGADAVFNNGGSYNTSATEFMNKWRNRAMQVHTLWDKAAQNVTQQSGNSTITGSGQPINQPAATADAQMPASSNSQRQSGAPAPVGAQPAAQPQAKAGSFRVERVVGPDGKVAFRRVEG